MHIFLFWMEHCGIWNRCILGFVKFACSTGIWTVNLLWTSDTIWWHRNWVNIGSGNGLVPDGAKPLLEPLLIGPQSLIIAYWRILLRYEFEHFENLEIWVHAHYPVVPEFLHTTVWYQSSVHRHYPVVPASQMAGLRCCVEEDGWDDLS